ncbi:hypothetical protein AOLI_G00076000 [Acnodon oligacanthus]
MWHPRLQREGGNSTLSQIHVYCCVNTTESLRAKLGLWVAFKQRHCTFIGFPSKDSLHFLLRDTDPSSMQSC